MSPAKFKALKFRDTIYTLADLIDGVEVTRPELIVERRTVVDFDTTAIGTPIVIATVDDGADSCAFNNSEVHETWDKAVIEAIMDIECLRTQLAAVADKLSRLSEPVPASV